MAAGVQPLSPRRAAPSQLSCVATHEQVDKAIDLVMTLLTPHIAADADGKPRLRPVYPKDFREIASPR